MMLTAAGSGFSWIRLSSSRSISPASSVGVLLGDLEHGAHPHAHELVPRPVLPVAALEVPPDLPQLLVRLVGRQRIQDVVGSCRSTVTRGVCREREPSRFRRHLTGETESATASAPRRSEDCGGQLERRGEAAGPPGPARARSSERVFERARSPENGRSPAGGAGLLNLNPVDGGSTWWVPSSGTWGVYRVDLCVCEYTHNLRRSDK